MKLLPQTCLTLLFLGTIWGNTHQVIADDGQFPCSTTQYMNQNLNKCCARCQPGFYVKNKCTVSSDTQCQSCSNGTYAAKWNYASTCRLCYPCGSEMIMKEPCSATHPPVCVCKDGYTCTQPDGDGICRNCEPIEVDPEPTEIPTKIPSNPLMNNYSLWLIPVILATLAIFAGCFLYYKMSIVKNFGHRLKLKKSVQSTPVTEISGSGSIVHVEAVVRGSPAEPLLGQEPKISMPAQEEGKCLSYPIQETDPSQSGECTLNST